MENDQAGQPISCYVRHLSPAGSFLSRDLYELAAKIAPSAQVASGNGRANDASRDWLKIEIGMCGMLYLCGCLGVFIAYVCIRTTVCCFQTVLLKDSLCACFYHFLILAGLSAPPFYTSRGYQRGEWLRQLADSKTVVSLQLLGRRVASSQAPAAEKKAFKREMATVLPELHALGQESSNSHVDDEEQVAVCWVYYRPSIFQLFATDLADSLVRYGHACVESEVFMKNDFTNDTKVIDASTGLEDLRKDIKRLDRLERSQLKGAEQSHGMWSDNSIREKRRDIMDEIEFQANANVFQRLWRWWRS